MKKVGLVLVSVGLALFLYIIFGIIVEENKILSPIPENQGVKVLFVSPPK